MPDTDPYAAIAKPITPSSTPPSGDDPYASIAKPAAGTATTGTQPYKPKSMAEQVFDTAGGIGGQYGLSTGIVRGAANTLSGVDQFVRKIPGMNKLPVSEAEHELQAIGEGGDTPEEQAGKFMESAAEFLMGDEALKGMSYADKLKSVMPSLKALENSPRLTKVLSTVLRQGAVGTAQGTAKSGGDIGTGLTEGAVAGGAGAALEGAMPLAGRLKYLLTMAEREKPIQADVQQAVREIINHTGQDAGVGNTHPPSLRDTAANMATKLGRRASVIYDQLDEATGGGRFQRFQSEWNELTDQIRNTSDSDPQAKIDLMKQRNSVEKSMQDAFDKARAQGVDPDLIKEANTLHGQRKAMEEVSEHIRSTTSGTRPEHVTDEMPGEPEKVDAGNLFKRLDGMYNTGTLQQALGPDKATDLLNEVKSAEMRTTNAQKSVNRAKTIAKAGAYGAGLAGLARTGEHLYEGVYRIH
jgi:hypothetical protein